MEHVKTVFLEESHGNCDKCLQFQTNDILSRYSYSGL